MSVRGAEPSQGGEGGCPCCCRHSVVFPCCSSLEAGAVLLSTCPEPCAAGLRGGECCAGISLRKGDGDTPVTASQSWAGLGWGLKPSFCLFSPVPGVQEAQRLSSSFPLGGSSNPNLLGFCSPIQPGLGHVQSLDL